MRFRLLIVALVAGAVLGLFAPDRALRAQINQIDGSTGQFTATPSGGNYILSFTNPPGGLTQAFNAVPIPLANQNVTFFSSITLLGANGGAAFNQNFGAIDAGTKTIFGTTSGAAVFGNFSGLQWGVPSFQPRIMGISGNELLLSNTANPALNLGPFATALSNAITISLNIAASDFITLFNSGTTFTGTGSFSEIAGQGAQPPVPEPSSLAIWGSIMAAGWLMRRRMTRS